MGGDSREDIYRRGWDGYRRGWDSILWDGIMGGDSYWYFIIGGEVGILLLVDSYWDFIKLRGCLGLVGG